MTTRIERHSTAWHEALDAFVAQRTAMPFAWGKNDCCTLAADWVQIARGTDPMADLRGLNSAIAAARALDAAGGILQAVQKRMGPPLPGTFAQVGDVALVGHQNDATSMGVCVGAYIAAPGVQGLLMVPISRAEAAWRV